MGLIEPISAVLSFFPIIGLAALGGLLSQKSGVYNIAIEGIMAFGTFSGIFAYFYWQSLWLSLLFGFFCGTIFGALLSILSVRFKLNQIVIGFAIWFLAEGLAGFLYFVLVPGGVKVPERFGDIFLSLDPIFYLTIGLFMFFFIFFRWTKQGLAVKVAGESPEVADAAGINVYKIRWICNLIGAGLMGVAGSYLAVHILQGFTYQMVAGYGWVAFAIIMFGRWSPIGVLLSSLLFASLIGIQTRLQVAGIIFIPPEFMVVLPHIAVIIALTLVGIFGKKSGMPSALGVPYERE
ncbi:hypothetical protein ES703_30551 [subsurface metagenome]